MYVHRILSLSDEYAETLTRLFMYMQTENRENYIQKNKGNFTRKKERNYKKLIVKV